MDKWLERKSDWLNRYGIIRSSEKPKGRPLDDNLEYGVRFVPVRCPNCGSKNVMCYASRLPVRYHRCRECRTRFKSVEEAGK